MKLGIDIGGANTKIASFDGKITELYYLPLWKNSKLLELLKDISKRLSPQRVGVVITGELADCFSDKDTGISYIVDTVNSIFKNAYFLDSNCEFRKQKSRELAAANWMASSFVVAKRYGNCIFLDIGSTTTDIIPIKEKPLAKKTDIERLKNNELVYSGVLRTNIATIINKVYLNNSLARISSELFSITADVYLLLSYIKEEDYTCETPDNNGKTTRDAKIRLARVLCADLSEIHDSEIMEIAKQVMEKQLQDITDAVKNVSEKYKLDKIVACGIGEFLAEKIAKRLGLNIVLISQEYGKNISKVFPAYSVAQLIEVNNHA